MEKSEISRPVLTVARAVVRGVANVTMSFSGTLYFNMKEEDRYRSTPAHLISGVFNSRGVVAPPLFKHLHTKRRKLSATVMNYFHFSDISTIMIRNGTLKIINVSTQ